MQHKTKVSPILERDLEGAETRRCGSPSPMAVPRAAQGPNPPAMLAPGGGGSQPSCPGPARAHPRSRHCVPVHGPGRVALSCVSSVPCCWGNARRGGRGESVPAGVPAFPSPLVTPEVTSQMHRADRSRGVWLAASWGLCAPTPAWGGRGAGGGWLQAAAE